jgi:hypothetical protein
MDVDMKHDTFTEINLLVSNVFQLSNKYVCDICDNVNVAAYS